MSFRIENGSYVELPEGKVWIWGSPMTWDTPKKGSCAVDSFQGLLDFSAGLPESQVPVVGRGEIHDTRVGIFLLGFNIFVNLSCTLAN